MADSNDTNEEGPGAAFRVYTEMENVLDNLKVLDYERSYCKAFHTKPIWKYYFALPVNPGEQFNAFISLGAWLVRTCGYEMDQPQEYDDPNASITTLLQVVREINNEVSISPSKLKSGCGESVVKVLKILSDYALKKKGFIWSLAQYDRDEDERTNDDIVEEDGALDDDGDDEDDMEMNFDRDIDDDDDDDGEVMLDLGNVGQMNMGNTNDDGETEGTTTVIKPDKIIESNVNSAEWLLEVERVLPQLKVTIRNESRDWRTHRDQLHQHQNDLKACFTDVRPQIERLYEDLNKSVEKISTREKYLNSQVDQMLSKYRLAQEQLVVIRDKRKDASGGINQRTQTLVELTDELDRIKQQMEERGSNMSDGWPVARLRQAMQRLKAEMKQMLIRAGLLEHLLLQESLQAKSSFGGLSGNQLNNGVSNNI